METYFFLSYAPLFLKHFLKHYMLFVVCIYFFPPSIVYFLQYFDKFLFLGESIFFLFLSKYKKIREKRENIFYFVSLNVFT